MSLREEHSVQELRKRVSGASWVYCFGYSDEAIHRGVLVRVLRSPGSPQVLAGMWNKLCNSGEEVSAEEISCISPRREYPLERRQLDLLVEFKARGCPHAVLCEFKVDGASNAIESQCTRFEEAWKKQQRQHKTGYALIMLGGARFWQSPPLQGCGSFVQVDICDMLELVRQAPDSELLRDYEVALKDELMRGEIAPTLLHYDDRAALGYRGYDFWYALYNKVREAMDCASQRDWRIYSGGNNAVFNWWPALAGTEAHDIKGWGQLYCEMNGKHLCLKFSWADKNADQADRRKKLQDAAKLILPRQWKPTRAVPGTYVTLAKRPLCLSDVQGTAAELERFVAKDKEFAQLKHKLEQALP